MTTRIISVPLTCSSEAEAKAKAEATTNSTTETISTTNNTATCSRIKVSNDTTIIREENNRTNSTTTSLSSSSLLSSSIADETSKVNSNSNSNRSFHYVICDDPTNHSPFVNPTKSELLSSSSLSTSTSPTQFKWPTRSTTPPWILSIIVLLDTVFVSWWLPIAFQLWANENIIPLTVKRQLTFWAWEKYVSFHTKVVCKRMGCYQNNKNNPNNNTIISDEYKALSTLLYPSQFMHITIPRMRFSLSQLNTISQGEVPVEQDIERIEHKMNMIMQMDCIHIPEAQQNHCTVQGLYVRNPGKYNIHKDEDNDQDEVEMTTPTTASSNNNNKKKKRLCLFWIYGGAYLAGDAEGNLALANEFLLDCQAECVFIPHYRLAPEADINDVLWDICVAYHHFLCKLQEKEETEEEISIIIVGISSGGALALRLLQLLRDREMKKALLPSFVESLFDSILTIQYDTKSFVSGAVLFGPYIDYRDPLPNSEQNSFTQNAQSDLIVNEAVQYYGLPYLNQFIPSSTISSTTNNEEEETNHHNNTTATTNHHNNNNNNNNNNNISRALYSPITHAMNNLPPICVVVSEQEVTYDMTIELVNAIRKSSLQTNTNTTGGGGEVTIGIWKHMCHVFSMMQAFLPEGNSSIQFVKEWIRTKH